MFGFLTKTSLKDAPRGANVGLFVEPHGEHMTTGSFEAHASCMVFGVSCGPTLRGNEGFETIFMSHGIASLNPRIGGS